MKPRWKLQMLLPAAFTSLILYTGGALDVHDQRVITQLKGALASFDKKLLVLRVQEDPPLTVALYLPHRCRLLENIAGDELPSPRHEGGFI